MTRYPFLVTIATAILALAAMICCVSLSGCDAGQAADRPSTAVILAQAPTAQIVLDISGSSPALDQAYLDSVTPLITAAVKAMPVGTTVSIATAGDATVTNSALRLQIQARGTTADDVARKLARYLHAFPANSRGHEQGRSDLVGGFAAAAAAINHKTDANQLWVVSDLVEHSSIAFCGRSLHCKLPVKPGFDLSGAHVHVYGVGQGLPSDRAMQLTRDWQAFLIRAQAPDAELRRF